MAIYSLIKYLIVWIFGVVMLGGIIVSVVISLLVVLVLVYMVVWLDLVESLLYE